MFQVLVVVVQCIFVNNFYAMAYFGFNSSMAVAALWIKKLSDIPADSCYKESNLATVEATESGLAYSQHPTVWKFLILVLL